MEIPALRCHQTWQAGTWTIETGDFRSQKTLFSSGIFQPAKTNMRVPVESDRPWERAEIEDKHALSLSLCLKMTICGRFHRKEWN